MAINSSFSEGGKNTLDNIVMNLAHELPNKRHIIYADAGFGTFSLAKRLHEEGWAFTIAAPANRPSWLFSDCLHKRLRRGHVNTVTGFGKPVDLHIKCKIDSHRWRCPTDDQAAVYAL